MPWLPPLVSYALFSCKTTMETWPLTVSFLFSLPQPVFFKEMIQLVSSKYLVASPVLFPLSQMVRRVTRNVRSMESWEAGQVCPSPALGWESPPSAWPVEQPLFLTSHISGAQETSEMAPDENRAGAWRKTKYRWDRLSTEYILISY